MVWLHAGFGDKNIRRADDSLEASISGSLDSEASTGKQPFLSLSLWIVWLPRQTKMKSVKVSIAKDQKPPLDDVFFSNPCSFEKTLNCFSKSRERLSFPFLFTDTENVEQGWMECLVIDFFSWLGKMFNRSQFISFMNAEIEVDRRNRRLFPLFKVNKTVNRIKEVKIEIEKICQSSKSSDCQMLVCLGPHPKPIMVEGCRKASWICVSTFDRIKTEFFDRKIIKDGMLLYLC